VFRHALANRYCDRCARRIDAVGVERSWHQSCRPEHARVSRRPAERNRRVRGSAFRRPFRRSRKLGLPYLWSGASVSM